MNACDRCGPAVRAAWIVFLDHGPLLFCGHCWQKNYKHFVLRYRFSELKPGARKIPVRQGP